MEIDGLEIIELDNFTRPRSHFHRQRQPQHQQDYCPTLETTRCVLTILNELHIKKSSVLVLKCNVLLDHDFGRLLSGVTLQSKFEW